jgi:hypothetical protein
MSADDRCCGTFLPCQRRRAMSAIVGRPGKHSLIARFSHFETDLGHPAKRLTGVKSFRYLLTDPRQFDIL